MKVGPRVQTIDAGRPRDRLTAVLELIAQKRAFLATNAVEGEL